MIAISSTRLALYIVSQRRQKASEDQKERDAAQQAAQNNEDEKVSFLAFIMHVRTFLLPFVFFLVLLLNDDRNYGTIFRRFYILWSNFSTQLDTRPAGIKTICTLRRCPLT